MTNRNETKIFVPAPVDTEALDEVMRRSWAAIERSTAILNRLAATKGTKMPALMTGSAGVMNVIPPEF